MLFVSLNPSRDRFVIFKESIYSITTRYNVCVIQKVTYLSRKTAPLPLTRKRPVLLTLEHYVYSAQMFQELTFSLNHVYITEALIR